MNDVIAGQKSIEMLDYLSKRRSVLARNLIEPGPSKEEINTMLTIASRVPDHGKLSPMQYVLVDGEKRKSIGENILKKAYLNEDPKASEAKLQLEAERFMRSPLVIGVIYSPKIGKIPIWEQQLCVGAACQNLILAANAHGYGAQWLTEWYSFNKDVKQGFGLLEGEEFAGFIYIGSVAEAPVERARPDISSLIREL